MGISDTSSDLFSAGLSTFSSETDYFDIAYRKPLKTENFLSLWE